MRKHFLQKDKIFKKVLKDFLSYSDSGKDTDALFKKYRKGKNALSEINNIINGIKSFKNIVPGKDYKEESLNYIYSMAGKEETDVKSNAKKSVLSAAKFRPSFVRPLVVFVSVFLFILFSFAGTIFASAETVPGEALYTLKRSSENIWLALTPDKNKGKLYGIYLGRRLDEAEILLSTGDDMLAQNAGILLNDIDNTFTRCIEHGCLNIDDKESALSRIEQIKNKYRQRCGRNDSGSIYEGEQTQQENTETQNEEQQPGTDSSFTGHDEKNGYKKGDQGNGKAESGYNENGQGKKQQ